MTSNKMMASQIQELMKMHGSGEGQNFTEIDETSPVDSMIEFDNVQEKIIENNKFKSLLVSKVQRLVFYHFIDRFSVCLFI